MPIPPAPTPEQFEKIALAIDPESKVLSTHKFLCGLGCRMDVLELQQADESVRRVVTRQYWERTDSKPSERQVVESKILRALSSNGVPVPGPILDEETASAIFGRPGLVISYINGIANLGPADLHSWTRQLAEALAKVHSTPVPPELESLPQAHMISIKKWLGADSPPERFAKHELGPQLWEAMRSLWPSVDTSEIRILHNDFWPGNTLWRDDQLLAIVDWEWPALGVPTDDVGYFLTDAFYTGFDIEEVFLEAYEEHMGKPVSDLLFWKMLACCMPLPDVGPWGQGYRELGVRHMTAEHIRKRHHDRIKNLLEEFHSHA